jgi:general secretion pathway protein K
MSRKIIPGRRASILIIVLWILSFLTMLVVNLAFMVRTQLQFADHLQDRMKMYYLAKAGIERAVAELYLDETPAADSLNESWANNEKLFKDFPLGVGVISLEYKAGGSSSEEGLYLYGATDEGARIDINSAPEDVLVSLLERVGKVEAEDAIDLARSIMDWRDKDVALSTGGAENDYYQGLTDYYECKNGNFQIAEELLLVKGMTEEIFSNIKDVITVYNTGKVNINTAGYDCLFALGLNADLCEDIIEYRNGGDKIAGTEDDVVFNTPSELLSIGSLFTEEATQINSLISQGVLTVKSDTFRIISQGQIKNARGALSRRIVCVLKRRYDKDPKIMYWHEN